MDAPLKTWKLIPSTTPSALWSLSAFATAAYVRAEGPLQARQLAAERFRKYPARQSESMDFRSPWLDPDLVHCFEVADPKFCRGDSFKAVAHVEGWGNVPTFHRPSPVPAPEDDVVLPRMRSANWSDLLRMANVDGA